MAMQVAHGGRHQPLRGTVATQQQADRGREQRQRERQREQRVHGRPRSVGPAVVEGSRALVDVVLVA